MINLDYLGDPARVVLTLTEAISCGATDAAWLFVLTNKLTGATVAFTAPDVSQSPGRYNQFEWQSVGLTSSSIDVSLSPAIEGLYPGASGEYELGATINGYPSWQLVGSTGATSMVYFEGSTAVVFSAPSWVLFYEGGFMAYGTTGGTSPIGIPFSDGVGGTCTVAQFSPVDLYDGRFHVADSGTYRYDAYQMAITVPQDLDPANAIGLAETGTLILWESGATLPNFETPTTTIPTFE